jgi:hypothetical protein
MFVSVSDGGECALMSNRARKNTPSSSRQKGQSVQWAHVNCVLAGQGKKCAAGRLHCFAVNLCRPYRDLYTFAVCGNRTRLGGGDGGGGTRS